MGSGAVEIGNADPASPRRPARCDSCETKHWSCVGGVEVEESRVQILESKGPPRSPGGPSGGRRLWAGGWWPSAQDRGRVKQPVGRPA